MPRRLSIELVATGSQQVNQVLSNYSRQFEALSYQQDAIARAATGYQNKLFPTQGVQVFDSKVKEATRNSLGLTEALKLLNSFGSAGPVGTGFQVGPMRQQLDLLGNTIKVTNEGVLSLGEGLDVLGTKTVNYTGNVKGILAAQRTFKEELEAQLPNIEAAGKKIDELTAHYQPLIDIQEKAKESARTRIDIANERLSNVQTPLDVNSASYQSALTAATDKVKTLQAFVNRENERARLAGLGQNYDTVTGQQPYYLTAPYAEHTGRNGETIAASQGVTMQEFLQNNPEGYAKFVATQEKLLGEALAERTAITLNTTKEFSNANRQLTRAEDDLTLATRRAGALRGALTRQINELKPVGAVTQDIINRGNANVAAEFNAPPTLPLSIQTLQSDAPKLLSKLQGYGLGSDSNGVRAPIGSQDFINNLITQKAYESINIQKDLVKQVTRVTGSFLNEKGVLQSFSAEVDENGKVLTRFGANLSGIGNVLNQLGRDFQKVIEFAVATTVVFGGFQYVIKEISAIRELDKEIRQLSITANLTRTESVSLFQDIANVAIQTATPLGELVKATDDIALATRKAGQSSSDWRKEIIALTQSVGILTNLAGIDTVAATDQLVSTMKQLNIQATELPGILNKVTAVAGGQSNAIADIVKGLGVMSEASIQAGLSVDQMIATIQTLSQVTSKTPAEVATAFKNLLGSLQGPAGVKALNQYNIALRDGAGNLRNIIDIYSEIADKIAKGVIPQADVQALVRAISGGPRRAPDAAALLSSIGDIQTVTQKSINATNEALITNAKILDTTNAKFIQLQARIDKFATTKFADILNQSIEGLTKILEVLLHGLEQVPTSVFLIGIQFALLAANIKFALSIGSYFIASLKNVVNNLRILKNTLAETGSAYKQFSTAESTSSGQLTLFGNNVKKPAIRSGVISTVGAGLLGAGVSAAAGSSPTAAIGTGLETAGLAALAIPDLTVTKVAGAALIGLGVVLQYFATQSHDSAKANQENTESILNSIDAYKSASETLEGLKTKQGTLGDSLNKLNGIQNKTIAQNRQLVSTQQDYAQNAADQVSANLQLTESFGKLNATLEGTDLKSIQLTAASAGAYSKDQLQKLTEQYAPILLHRTNPNFVPPNDLQNFLPDFTPGKIAPTTGSSQVQIQDKPPITNTQGLALTNTSPIGFDLRDLETNAHKVQQLFDSTGSNFTAKLVPTYDNLQLIDTALKNIRTDLKPEEFDRYQASFQKYAASQNALFGAERNVALYSAYLEAGAATTLFKEEDVKRGQSILNLYHELINTIPIAQNAATKAAYAPGSGGYASGTQKSPDDIANETQSIADKFAQHVKDNTPISVADAKEFGTELLKNNQQFDDLQSKGEVLKTIALLFKAAKIEVKGLTDSFPILGAASSESLTQFQEDLDTLNNDTLKNTSQKLGELQAQFQNGQFFGNEEDFFKQRDALNAVLDSVTAVTKAYQDGANNIQGLDTSILTLEPGLTKLNGLQDAQGLTAGELFKRFYDLAGIYGLNSEQVKALSNDLTKLLAGLQSLAQLRTDRPELNLSFDPKQALAQLQDLRQKYIDSQSIDASGRNLTSTPFDSYIKLITEDILGFDNTLINSYLGSKTLPTNTALQTELESIAKKFSDAQQNILVQKNSGQFDKDAAGLKKLTDNALGAYNAQTRLAIATSKLSSGELKNFADALSRVNGLYYVGKLSASELKTNQESLGTTMLENAAAAGVNAKGLDEIAQAAVNLTNQINGIPTYHEIIVEIKTITDNLSAVDAAVAAGQGFSMAQIAEIQRQKAQLAKDIKDKATAEKAANDFQKTVNKITASGNSRTPTAGNGPNVSTLDLPDQIAASRNRNATIQEAIRNARALQSQIPGANKAASNDIVELLAGTKRVTEVRGVKEDLLRKALDELTTAVKSNTLQVSNIDLPDQIATASNRSALIQEAIKRATKLQSVIPGETKAASNDVVELLKGTQRVLEVRGVKDDYLRKALEELAAIEKKRLDFETKADTIRRIRVAGADFSAIANVPVNSQTGVSLGGSQGPINVTLNLNGTLLTPAQFGQFANLVASSLKRQIALGTN